MNKVFVVAVREYLAAVRTKGFIIGIIIIPLLMTGGLILQGFTQNIRQSDARDVVVIDRSPGASLSIELRSVTQEAISAPAKPTNGAESTTSEDAEEHQARYKFSLIPADRMSDADLNAHRLWAAGRVRRGELYALIEIGPKIFQKPPADSTRGSPATTASAEPTTSTSAPSAVEETTNPTSPPAADNPADYEISYTSSRPAQIGLRDFVRKSLQPTIIARRTGQTPQLVSDITDMLNTLVVTRSLPVAAAGGGVTFESNDREMALVVLPIVMVMLMLVVVLVGASPLTTNIIEEKQLRIAEVLLGSVRPFQLMLGKLIGGVATSLTLGGIYLIGAVIIAARLDIWQVVTPTLLVWFVIFTIIASLMYGAMFIVAGAAATNVKEAQALMTPMMLIVVLPMFLIGPMMEEPHGLVARIGTFFPLSSPMVTVMRLAVPPGLPWWQPVLAAVESMVLMAVLVWIAGRVFRAGFLLVGRPASMRELLRWVLRG